MPTIRQSVLLEAYRRLMAVWEYPYRTEISARLRVDCMTTAIDIKVALGEDVVQIKDDKPQPL